MMDEKTVRKHFQTWESGGVDALKQRLYRGRVARLISAQKESLSTWLNENLHLNVVKFDKNVRCFPLALARVQIVARTRFRVQKTETYANISSTPGKRERKRVFLLRRWLPSATQQPPGVRLDSAGGGAGTKIELFVSIYQY